MRFEVSITPFQQRLIAIVLALAPLFAIGAMLFSFVIAQIDHHARVALLVRELAQERALLAHSSQWEDRLAQTKSSPIWQGLFVQSAPNGQASAVARIVSNAGSTVEQSSVKRIESDHATEQNEHLVFKADINTLSQILFELRRSQSLFVIRALSVQDLEATQSTPRSVPNALNVELTVTGFVRP